MKKKRCFRVTLCTRISLKLARWCTGVLQGVKISISTDMNVDNLQCDVKQVKP